MANPSEPLPALGLPRGRVRDSVWIVAVVILGLTFSFGAFHSVRQWDRERAELHFSLQAQATASAVRGEAEACNELLHNLGELLGRRVDLSRAEFAEVVQPVCRRHPGLRALEWVPIVTSGERAGVEELAARELARPFEFTQTTTNGLFQPAGNAAFYRPILYIEPLVGNESALGYDLGRGLASAVLDQACDLGDLVLSPPIRLLQEPAQQLGYTVIMPVYLRGKIPATLAERRARLLGFAQAVVRTGDFLRSAIQQAPTTMLNLMVLDTTKGSPVRFVQYLPAKGVERAAAPTEEAMRTGWHSQLLMTLGTRQFALVFQPTAEALAAARSINPLGALGSGLLLTAGSVLYLRTQLRRTARVEAEVATRTVELMDSNGRLAAEISARQTVERELARQLQLLRTVIDTIPDSIYIKDKAGRFLLHNAANRRLLELAPGDDGTGRTVHDFAATKAHAEAYTADDRALFESGRSVFNREEGFTQAGGSIGWFLTTKVPVLDERGEITGIVGVSRDITQRRVSQQALAESEARFRTLFESSPDAVFVESEAGVVLDVNLAAARLHGTTREDLIGKHVAELVPPERRADIGKNFAGLFTLGTTILEGESYTKDGRVVPIELAARLCEYRGQVAVLLHVRDISERHHAAAALLRRDRILHAVTRAAQSLLHARSWQAVAGEVLNELGLATQASAVCLFANEAKGEELAFRDRCLWPPAPADAPPSPGLGYHASGCARWLELLARGETVHGNVADLPPSEQAVPRAKGMQSVALTPIFADTTWWGFLALGQTGTPRVWSLIEQEALKAAAEVFGAAIHRAQVEAERSRMEAKLLGAQKLESLGVLAGGIAHDFNNLLTSILGNASLARLHIPAGSQPDHSLQQIEQTSMRAAELCKQMLAYAGKGRFVVQRVDVSHLVRDITHLLHVSISKNSHIEFDLAPNLPAVMADAAQLRQIVMNLVINAAEAVTERSGLIRLTTGVLHPAPGYFEDAVCAPTEVGEGYVFLRVQDNGCGMTPAVRARIFEPFYTTKFTGRGLGLAATLGIIRGHQGALKVESTPGVGSTFTLLLPCTSEAAAAAIAPVATSVAWKGTGRILVVDDEETVRNVISQALEAFGFSVLLAGNGREGVALFRANPAAFTAVVMDWTMPELNGLEAFEQMRQIQPTVRVLLMSGYNAEDATAQLGIQGLAGFLQKPFDLGELCEKIRGIVMEREN